MRVKIWGARGSLPSPIVPVELEKHIGSALEGFFEAGYRDAQDIPRYLEELPRHRFGGYGGNTPCVEVSGADRSLIIDGGSGVRLCGYDLLKGPCGRGQGEVHLFLTHFHWDHLIGLPFFTPIFIPGNKVHFYAVQPELESVIRAVFKKPFFPLNFEQLGAKIEFHTLEPRKPFRLGEISLTPYQLDHPDPCWGYRIERGGKVFSYCVDTECKRVSRDQLGADLPLYQGVDLLVFDAQYTLLETLEKVDWGHAAASLGLEIAVREAVKQVIFMHHDPASSFEKIAMAESEAKRYYDRQLKTPTAHPLNWGFAYDGMTIDL